MSRTLPLVMVLAVALGVALVSGAAAENISDGASYHRSNEIGIPFEKISPTTTADYRFVLVHRRGAASSDEERLLLEEGRQVRLWVTRFDVHGGRLSESDYVEGALVANRNFDASGRLARSATYADGELVSRITYAYEPWRVRVTAVGPSGTMQFLSTYEFAATGQLRDFVRIAPGQDPTGAHFVFASGSLVEEVLTTGSTRLVSRYLAGERYQVEEWRGDTLHEVREVERSPEGILIAETVVEPARERRTTTSFDGSGWVVEVLTTKQGQQVELVHHVRDAAGRIVTTIRKSVDGEERLHYEYAEDELLLGSSGEGPDDRLRSERYEQDGLLVRVITYKLSAAGVDVDDELPTRQVDFYRDGRPVLREHYRGDVKTHVQVLRDGQVIRERVFDDDDDGGGGAER